MLQAVGLAAYSIPGLILMLGWKWVRSSPIEAPWAKIIGSAMCAGASCTALALLPEWRPIASILPAGGLLGLLMADVLISILNTTGAIIATFAVWVLSLYLISSFEMARLHCSTPDCRARNDVGSVGSRLQAWRERRAEAAKAKSDERVARRTATRKQKTQELVLPAVDAVAESGEASPSINDPLESQSGNAAMAAAAATAPIPPAKRSRATKQVIDTPPWEETPIEDIPIRELELPKPQEMVGPKVDPEPATIAATGPVTRARATFTIPPTQLLQEPAARTAWDSQELKETAALIKSKFEEFNVRGSVTQIIRPSGHDVRI